MLAPNIRFVAVTSEPSGASMSCRIFFLVEVQFFCLRFAFCFCFGMAFQRLLAGVLWCVSTWFVVTFNVAKRDVWGCWLLCGKINFGRRRRQSPYTFFYLVALLLLIVQALVFNRLLGC